MLLVDKYRPKSLEQTDYHKVLATRLHNLVRDPFHMEQG